MAVVKTKDLVLDYLKVNNGKFVSGQLIAKELFLTRASVWKAINALRGAGYEIESVTNKGYRLLASVDRLDAISIAKKLTNSAVSVEVFEELDSTNDEARRRLLGGQDRVLIISECQKNGRGRRGRSFYSPYRSGLYMSIGFRSELRVENATHITSIAAVAVAEVIDEIINEAGGKATCGIKWVNDIFIGDRKVCGILTEAYGGLEDQGDNFYVVGIGINVNEAKDPLPKELVGVLGTIAGQAKVTLSQCVRDELAARITDRFLGYYIAEDSSYIAKYRSKSCIIGAYVKINNFNKSKPHKYGKVIGINDACHLIIEYDNGKQDELSSGEVSVVKY